ncbi:MAG: hydrogenase maturation protease [Methylocystis sp.]|nr:MAG: hydrogenase maturation protease [Methylocystis sp.]
MRIRVIGVGNLDRGDDGAGRAVARRLRATELKGIEVAEQEGEATSLLNQFEGADLVYLVDACLSGAPAGAIHRFDAAAAPLPGKIANFSSHGFGLAAAVELARTLGALPPRCIVYAIEGENFAVGVHLSGAVQTAVETVTAELISLISRQ